MTPSQFTEHQRRQFEERFREARRKIILADVAYFSFLIVSVFLLIGLREEAVRGTVSAFVAGSLALWWYHRRLWRCPAFETLARKRRVRHLRVELLP